MELFKACEKEMKIKAFSKEGLASNKMDPREKAKHETRQWITDVLENLATSIETTEGEIEALQAAGKKMKKSEGLERAENLNQQLSRLKFHQYKLEFILRNLENDTIEPDQVCLKLKSFSWALTSPLNSPPNPKYKAKQSKAKPSHQKKTKKKKQR